MQSVNKIVGQPLLWLGVCILLSLFVLVYPIYVIRPFRYQGASELEAALTIVRLRPALVVVLSLAAVATAALCWIGPGRGIWQKAAASAGAFLVILLAFLSRINVYELMFHALDNPTFSRASEIRLDGREEVIAIHAGGEMRAYPVRSMSYHHIVNDVVVGLPVVATY